MGAENVVLWERQSLRQHFTAESEATAEIREADKSIEKAEL